MNSKKKVYEVGYIIVPTVSPDHISKEVDLLHATITKNDGEIIAEEAPRLRPLAYEMLKVTGNERNKFDTGHFGWVKFYGTEDGIGEIKKALDVMDKVLRYIIVKTVAESTLYGHKITPEKTKSDKLVERVVPKPEEKVEINEEELDKSIDKLVIE